MNQTPFPHSERALCAALGIDQKKIRSIRQDELTRGTEWDQVSGHVHYSDAGRAALLARLQIASPAEHSAPKNSSAEPLAAPPPVPDLSIEPSADASLPAHTIDALQLPAPGTVEVLQCVKCYRPNIRMIEAKRACGAIVLVRVRDNKNLRPGMAMKCQHGTGRIWELAQRLPRYPGKW